MTEIEAFTRYRKRAGLNKKYESIKRHQHISTYLDHICARTHVTDIAHAMWVIPHILTCMTEKKTRKTGTRK